MNIIEVAKEITEAVILTIHDSNLAIGHVLEQMTEDAQDQLFALINHKVRTILDSK